MALKIKLSSKAKKKIIYILAGLLAVIVIAVIIFAKGTVDRKKVKLGFKLDPAKSTLRGIINREKRYFEKNGSYVSFPLGASCDPIGFEHPGPDIGVFEFGFDAKTQTATAKERPNITPDANKDNDGNDGLTLTIDGVQGNLKGSKGWDLNWD